MRAVIYWNLFRIAPVNTRFEDWAFKKYLSTLWTPARRKRFIDAETQDTTSRDPRTEGLA